MHLGHHLGLTAGCKPARKRAGHGAAEACNHLQDQEGDQEQEKHRAPGQAEGFGQGCAGEDAQSAVDHRKKAAFRGAKQKGEGEVA